MPCASVTDRLMLLLSAFNLLPQAIPMLWGQDTLLTMLSGDEKAKLESSGFATWCIMPHLGCLLLVLALLCVLATQLDRKPRCAMHVVLLVYTGSAIYYHYRMMLVQGQKPLPPPWFREPETFWFNIYALLFSTAVNGVGTMAALLGTDPASKAGAKED
mmetsp:Transcript_33720/g.78326  ORF Transcript_33720/g.78326 Transcript_33720/m.78326 type:complete len:159 (-) Transcript_33720:91-567(-)